MENPNTRRSHPDSLKRMFVMLLAITTTFSATVYADLDSAFTTSPLKSHAYNWY